MKPKVSTTDRKRPCGRDQSNRKGDYKLPLKGKTIFLHLTGYRGQVAFERDIKLLGATVEKCFSKEVDCLVTTKGTPADYEKKRSKTACTSMPSPVTPSPFNMANLGVDSPQGQSPGSVEAQKPLTRGKAMAQAAKTTKCYGSTDVLETARTLKIRIIHVESALKWIKKAIEKLPIGIRIGEDASTSHDKGRAKVRRLRGAYVKFEARSGHYRPVKQEFQSWPQIHLDTAAWSCPFEKDKGNKDSRIYERGEGEERDPQEPAQDVLDSDSKPQLQPKIKSPSKRKSSEEWFSGRILTAGEVKRMMKERKRAEMKRGYCELCQIKYENIDQHVANDQHRKFVRNKSNYSSLDTMIDSGPNMQEFLSSVLEAHKKRMLLPSPGSVMDEVLLLSDITELSPDSKRQMAQNEKSGRLMPSPQKLLAPHKTQEILPRNRKTRASGAYTCTPAAVNTTLPVVKGLPRPILPKEYLDESIDVCNSGTHSNSYRSGSPMKNKAVAEVSLQHSPRRSDGTSEVRSRNAQSLQSSTNVKVQKPSPRHSRRSTRAKCEETSESALPDTAQKAGPSKGVSATVSPSPKLTKRRSTRTAKSPHTSGEEYKRIRETSCPSTPVSPNVRHPKHTDRTLSPKCLSTSKRTRSRSKPREEEPPAKMETNAGKEKTSPKTPKTVTCSNSCKLMTPRTTANIRRILKKSGSPRVICTPLNTSAYMPKDLRSSSRRICRGRTDSDEEGQTRCREPHKVNSPSSKSSEAKFINKRVLRSRDSSLTNISSKKMAEEKPQRGTRESIAEGVQGEVGESIAEGVQGEVGESIAEGVQGEVGESISEGVQGEVGESIGEGVQGEVVPDPEEVESGPVRKLRSVRRLHSSTGPDSAVDNATNRTLAEDTKGNFGPSQSSIKHKASPNESDDPTSDEPSQTIHIRKISKTKNCRSLSQSSHLSRSTRSSFQNLAQSQGVESGEALEGSPEKLLKREENQKESNTPIQSEAANLSHPPGVSKDIVDMESIKLEKCNTTPVKTCKTPDLGTPVKQTMCSPRQLLVPTKASPKKNNQNSDVNNEGCSQGSVHGSRKIRLKHNWSLMSERSMKKLLEEEDNQDFEGFTEDSIDKQGLPSDATYNEVSEVEIQSESEVDWVLNSESNPADASKECAIYDGLDVSEGEIREEASTPLKNLLKNVPELSSDASSTDWDDNLDKFFNDQVERKKTNGPSPRSCHTAFGHLHRSPRRSPRKGMSIYKYGTSPLKVVSSPLKKNSVTLLHTPRNSQQSPRKVTFSPGKHLVTKITFSPEKTGLSPSNANQTLQSVRRSPRKHITPTANAQFKSPLVINKTLDFSTPDFNLLDGAVDIDPLWVGPTKNEKVTPSYTDKAAQRLAALSKPSTPQRCPVYKQVLCKGIKSQQRSGLKLKSPGPRHSTPCKPKSDSAQPEKKETGPRLELQAKLGTKTYQVNMGLDTMSTDNLTATKTVDSEVTLNFSSPQKTSLKDQIQEMTFPSPLTPLDGGSKCQSKFSRTPNFEKQTLTPNLDLTQPEELDPPKKKLLKCGSNKKRTISVGYASFDYDKSLLTKLPGQSQNLASPTGRPKTPGSGVRFSNLGAKLKPKILEASTSKSSSPISHEIFNWPDATSPVRQSPRKHRERCLDKPIYSPQTSPKPFSRQTEKYTPNTLETSQDQQQSSTHKRARKAERSPVARNARSSPSLHSPGRSLTKLLQLHSLDNIKAGPRRESSVVTSIVRFHHDDYSPPKPLKRKSESQLQLSTEGKHEGKRRQVALSLPRSKSLATSRDSRAKSPAHTRSLPRRLRSLSSPRKSRDSKSDLADALPRKRLCMASESHSEPEEIKTSHVSKGSVSRPKNKKRSSFTTVNTVVKKRHQHHGQRKHLSLVHYLRRRTDNISYHELESDEEHCST